MATSAVARYLVGKRLKRRKVERAEKGLALLDVLIGMAMIALIAIIAFSAIGQYRARAYEAGAVSDARQVGIALESAYADAGSYADPMTELPDGVTLTRGNAVATFGEVDRTFSVCVSHETGAFAVFDSGRGGIVDKGRSGGCQSSSSGGSQSSRCTAYMSLGAAMEGEPVLVNMNVYAADGAAMSCPNGPQMADEFAAAVIAAYPGSRVTEASPENGLWGLRLPSGIPNEELRDFAAAWLAEHYPDFEPDLWLAGEERPSDEA